MSDDIKRKLEELLEKWEKRVRSKKAAAATACGRDDKAAWDVVADSTETCHRELEAVLKGEM